MIFWGFLTSAINEVSANCFIPRAMGYIRNVPLPVSVHLYQMLMRNLIIWVFNMAIYVVVLLLFGINPGWTALLFLVGGPIFLINAAWMGLVAGILSTRFRDIPQVITSLIQVVFFLTPIFWSTATMPTRPAFVTFNPLYHLLTIVRDPLLGEVPPADSWYVSIALALAGLLLAGRLYRRAQPRIAYWV